MAQIAVGAAQRLLAALPRAAAADPPQPLLSAQPCCSTTSRRRPSPLLLHDSPTNAGTVGSGRRGRAGPPSWASTAPVAARSREALPMSPLQRVEECLEQLGVVESTINQVVSKRMVTKQQMRWTPEG